MLASVSRRQIRRFKALTDRKVHRRLDSMRPVQPYSNSSLSIDGQVDIHNEFLKEDIQRMFSAGYHTVAIYPVGSGHFESHPT